MTRGETDRDFLRHTVATVAYRAAKAMRGAPAGFAEFRIDAGSRSAVEILAHMSDLFDWATSMATGRPAWNTSTPGPWDAERTRFFAALRTFDEVLASGVPLHYETARLFQGPVADALTHTGQIALLRRAYGSPVRGESYNRAEIRPGRVGQDQTPPDPRYEFD